MPDRIASDHPSLRTVRAHVVRHGGGRHRLELPVDDTDVLPADGVLEVVVDERRRFGRCRTVGGHPGLVGLYETHAAATGAAEGANRLDGWLDRAGRRRGSSVLVDVLTEGERIGLRSPGEETVYHVVRPRDSSLDDIARDLLGDG